MNLRKDIAAPVAACSCGWVSHIAKYDLKYHADVHKCKLAMKGLAK